jgi:hypothetical protein
MGLFFDSPSPADRIPTETGARPRRSDPVDALTCFLFGCPPVLGFVASCSS